MTLSGPLTSVAGATDGDGCRLVTVVARVTLATLGLGHQVVSVTVRAVPATERQRFLISY